MYLLEWMLQEWVKNIKILKFSCILSPFMEAIKELTQSSKHEDSEAEESDNTKELDLETGSSGATALVLKL